MLLTVENVTKTYRNGVKANISISFSVSRGEVFGLLGPNGAGKTTLVNQIIGLLKTTSGTIWINGIDVVKNPAYAREKCSFQPQTQVPIEGLTPLQAIEIVGRLRGGEKGLVKKRSRQLLEKLQLEPWLNSPGERLSGGVKRMVAFCMAVVVPGDILILDEPTNDVDPLRRRLLWQEIRTVSNSGTAVLLVTHNVLEAERSVDRLAIIDQAKILKIGTPATFKEYHKDFLVLEVNREPSQDIPDLPSFTVHHHLMGNRLRLHVRVESLSAAIEWAQRLKKEETIEEFSVGPANLEDAYLELTGSEEADRPEFQQIMSETEAYR